MHGNKMKVGSTSIRSRYYILVMFIMGLGIGAVGFFYIHLLDLKHQEMVKCYVIEKDIRNLNEELLQLFHEFHATLAIKDMDRNIADLNLEISYPAHLLDFTKPISGEWIVGPAGGILIK